MFVGETDFPCLSDERVGGGRTYVNLQAPPSGDEGYAAWISGLTSSQFYAGDGRSHIFDFELSSDGLTPSGKEHLLPGPRQITITAIVCALLDAEPSANTERIRNASPYDKPYWHLERARINGSRKVALDVIVDGYPVQQHEFEADGSLQFLIFQVQVEQSCWIALRILPPRTPTRSSYS